MDFDEKRLVAKAQKGNKQAFTELYQHYHNELFYFLRARANNREDALDMVSEIFIRVIRFLPNFRGDSSFRTWLYHIAKNMLVDYYTAHAKSGSLELEEEQWLRIGEKDEDKLEIDENGEFIENDEQSKIAAEVDIELQSILVHLPENYREIIELRDLFNCSYKECAETMKISENNAKVMHLRALNYARKVAGVKIREKSLKSRTVKEKM